MKFTFKNYEDLIQDMRKYIAKLPRFDAVFGVPRSGMIPAAFLSLAWNVPLNLDFGGDRCLRKEIKTALIIDDSCRTGKNISKFKEQLTKSFPSIEFKTATVYISEATDKSLVDYYYKEIAMIRRYEWNILHQIDSKFMCFDMDGVLCRDPTREENDRGKQYEIFLKEATPLYLPTHPIFMIVTGRLEQYREQTEEWLAKHGVKYQHLVMRPFGMDHISHKVFTLTHSDSNIFIESEKWQAEIIAKQTNKLILCLEDWRFY